MTPPLVVLGRGKLTDDFEPDTTKTILDECLVFDANARNDYRPMQPIEAPGKKKAQREKVVLNLGPRPARDSELGESRFHDEMRSVVF